MTLEYTKSRGISRNAQLACWLHALYLNVPPRQFLQWLAHFPTIRHFFSASDEEWLTLGISAQLINVIKHRPEKRIVADLVWSTVADQYLITYEDESYPTYLKAIDDPPLILFVRGNFNALQQPQLAMVGSRNPSRSGIKNAEYFAYHLASAGLAITSGLALGIDGAAHRGVLNAKGVTLAVFGTGLKSIYPCQHERLANEIVEKNGVLISELPLASPPRPWHFPRRNRIISGLSKGVLIVEAALQSGSLITARLALEQGREVFAIPGSIHSPQSRGCHLLIKQGAKLVENINDILEEINFTEQNKVAIKNSSQEKDPLPKAYQQILQCIEYEMTSFDVIICRSGLTAKEVSSILLTLELCDFIQPVAGGYVRI